MDVDGKILAGWRYFINFYHRFITFDPISAHREREREIYHIYIYDIDIHTERPWHA